MSRRRRSEVVHASQGATLVAISFTPLRDVKPLTVQRAREGRMRGVRTGGAHDYKVDCPSPSITLVYVSRSLFEVPRGGRWLDVSRAGLGGEGCGCWAVCPVALALLFAVTVFAL